MWALLTQCSALPESVRAELSRFQLIWRFQYPVSWMKRTLKRAFDLSIALTALLLASPVFALVAAAVKITSRGGVFYTQIRMGRDSRLFRIIKFRSMRTNAEANGPVWSSGTNDPRLTPIGGLLRHSHLDELPQLWNVARGEMSLVGPRPERPHFVKKLRREIQNYHERHTVKPGITGLAQVNYRYDASIKDVKNKLRYDRLYVKRTGLGLDASILFKTTSTILFRRFIPYLKGRNSPSARTAHDP